MPLGRILGSSWNGGVLEAESVQPEIAVVGDHQRLTAVRGEQAFDLVMAEEITVGGKRTQQIAEIELERLRGDGDAGRLEFVGGRRVGADADKGLDRNAVDQQAAGVGLIGRPRHRRARADVGGPADVGDVDLLVAVGLWLAVMLVDQEGRVTHRRDLRHRYLRLLRIGEWIEIFVHIAAVGEVDSHDAGHRDGLGRADDDPASAEPTA